MNNRTKTIVSITGITIVLLALLGLTYGYYLTRIQGNTNTNSISITTADLTLKYDDGSSYINLTNIMPGTITNGEGDNPEPKVFTVTNDGSGDVEYSIGMDEVTNTLTRTQDLTYSIACQEKLISAADTAYTACATTPSNSGEYPKTNSFLFTNQIKQNYVQKYTVVISYANPDEDQSIDMGSTIKGRMQIYSVPESIDITGTVTGATTGDYVQINSNPKTSVIASDGTYKLIGVEPGTHTLKVMNGSTTKGTKEIIVKQGIDAGISGNTITFTESDRVATVNVTSISTTLGVNITEIKDEKLLLKDAIIENAQKASLENSTTKTIYSETPLTTPATEANGETERTLSLTTDDYGDSYYYRGNVEDNYVTFADMCWRIVRIVGDGSTKLILEDQDEPCSVNISRNWALAVDIDATSFVGNFGSTNYEINALTASDGTTKNSKNMYWVNYLHGQGNYDKSMATVFKRFQSTFTDNELSKLKAGDWCIGNTAYSRTGSSNSTYEYELLDEIQVSDNKINATSIYYDSYVRLTGYNKDGYQASLKCNGNMMDDWEDSNVNPSSMYIGAITADEVIYAGGTYATSNQNYYLINEEFIKGSNGATRVSNFFTLSLSSFSTFIVISDLAFYIDNKGQLLNASMSQFSAFRPVITLKSGSIIKSGDGTQNNPYIIG